MAPVLGYWSIRGLAQPIRLLLNFAGVEFEDKLYNYGPAPGYDRSSWMNVKHSFGLDFPNLPYYTDGDLKLTQSVTILRYLGQKHKLVGKSEEELIRVDLAEQQLVDLKMGFTQLCYRDDFEEKKEAFRQSLKPSLKMFSEFLGKNQYFAGDKLTYVDFMAYETFDSLKTFDSECLKEFQNLTDFLERFEKLPAIAKYMQSDKFMKFPLNGDMAKFGSRSSGP